MLIVIDPQEMGLYGYDPYMYTFPTVDLFLKSDSLSSFINSSSALPAFYGYFSIVKTILGEDIQLTAKYLPLIGVLSPIFIYIAFKRIAPRNIAFAGALMLPATRTFYLFDSKFVDEILATVLFFVIIAIIFSVKSSRRRRLYLFMPVSLSLSLSHSLFALFCSILLGIFFFIPIVSEYFPSRFQLIDSDPDTNPIYMITLVIFFILILVFFGKGFTSLLFSLFSLDTTLSAHVLQETTKVSELPDLVFRVLILYGLIILFAFLTKSPFEEWEFEFATYSGICLGIFFLLTKLSDTIPIDAIRLLILFLPIIYITTISTVLKIIKQENFAKIIVITLTVILLLTQVTAIQPHVMFSDKSTTRLDEGHYSPQQFKASEWAKKYSDDPVVGFEKGLWLSNDNPYIPYGTQGNCESKLISWRIQQSRSAQNNLNVIFSAGKIKLQKCDLV
ncbi:hypothetical protein EGO51_09060 [Haloarcula hispanica]|uniref:Glycosyltransferase RgtA/B/C/D-like domain-containing protein n=1 Tax=Haloarcula hispanica TaxID=51589 RepID=A0A5J5LKF6_HALHI|nr:hypothetical protein [Haloarcula hispanica]KAA9409945.1 hypothetical protein EGO51_09060 [Haloarcula hispanica]